MSAGGGWVDFYIEKEVKVFMLSLLFLYLLFLGFIALYEVKTASSEILHPVIIGIFEKSVQAHQKLSIFTASSLRTDLRKNIKTALLVSAFFIQLFSLL